MTTIAQMHGLALLAVICLLIFIEECGVPVPFAPGDLLLAVCGLAIRNGDIHPALGLAAVYLATLAGAMSGRELFESVGARLLRRLTGTTRLRGPLERAARLLERGGWPAVLVGRVTPGLRIHTNEVAGLLGLPRRTFLLGLAPGAALYVGVFTGAGWLFGRPVMAFLLHTVHRFGLGVTVALVVVGWVAVLWLGARLLRERETGSESGRA
ncbi:MAG TPA: VTT domain-containing protein [Candidatus Dormibacteraeota bacterium]|nr:VTT domain-containing protein [Candidatus Dormibacteraeota bacterium]